MFKTGIVDWPATKCYQ